MGGAGAEGIGEARAAIDDRRGGYAFYFVDVKVQWQVASKKGCYFVKKKALLTWICD